MVIDTNNIDVMNLTLDDLVQADPPPRERGSGYLGLAGKFKQLIKETPGVWYEFPKIVSSRSITQTDNYEWTQRTVYDADGKRLGLRLYGRYTG